MPTPRSEHTKLQRWTDLIATLLVRQYPATFEELAKDIPAYAMGTDPSHKDSVKRTFERDKDELRELGVPIETVPIDEGESAGYRLRATKFYLPYLTLAGAANARAPRAEGYRALPEVAIEPDERSLLAEAVDRLERLGDPVLADHARSAGGKLLFDLPFLDAGVAMTNVLGTQDGASPETFERLADALRARKCVSFRYHTPATGSSTERRVDPYGLFFVSSHWYLAAFDRTRDGVRNFRLSRMSDVTVNRKKPQTADYDIPADFELRAHSELRSAWELGEADPSTAEVRFTLANGAVRAAAMLGEPVGGQEEVRRFPVRRVDVFARWLLSFAGDAVPLTPPALVQSYQQLARETLNNYTGATNQANQMNAMRDASAPQTGSRDSGVRGGDR